MPVAITTLGLGRARRTDASPQAVVNGTGFSAANNTVLVGGSVAAIVVQGATQITFNLPAPFSLDLYEVRSIHVPVLVINNDTGEQSTQAWLWLKGDLDEVADERLRSAVPGPFEVTGSPERPDYFEARDMERLATLIEALLVDVEVGNVLAHDGTKLAEPAGLRGSGAGQLLVVDPGEPTSLRWSLALDFWARFGGQAGSGVVGLMVPGADRSTGVNHATAGSENWAPEDGTLDLVQLHVNQLNGATLEQVRVLVNGAPAYDSGAGLGAGPTYAQVISVAVSKGDAIELEITCSVGASHFVQCVGGIRLLLD